METAVFDFRSKNGSGEVINLKDVSAIGVSNNDGGERRLLAYLKYGRGIVEIYCSKDKADAAIEAFKKLNSLVKEA